MHPDDKRRFVERAQRAIQKHFTYEELKRRKEEIRRRKAERRKKGPRVRALELDDDEEALDEPLRRVRGVARPPRPPSKPRAADETSAEELATARVVGLARTRATLAAGGELLEAAYAPGLELAVGDRVGFERRAGGLVLVRAVAPRTSWLARPDPSGTGRLLLAANVDLVCAVVAAREPRWRPGFVERVGLAAEEGRARALVVVNKLDRIGPEERLELERELAGLGMAAVRVSAASGEGLPELVAALSGKVCVFLGPSGVGKSSLANVLDPAGGRTTAPVRASDGKGRHTTTATQWTELPNGTVLIDTPGVRELGLLGLDARTLDARFPELAELATRCRFRDCSHLVEPACAVQAALAGGGLDPRRFARYCRLRATLE